MQNMILITYDTKKINQKEFMKIMDTINSLNIESIEHVKEKLEFIRKK